MVQSKTIAALVCLATLGSASAASAADVPRYVDNAVAYASPSSDRWSGFYAGVHLGLGMIDMPVANDRDYLGGLQVGYNHQFGLFMVGAELEGSYGNRLRHVLPGGGVHEQTWSGVAKARAGLAMDNFLLFGTAGVAMARFEGEGTISSPDRWQTGLAFGGGVEFAVTESISAKLEYTQTRFHNVPATIGGVARSDNLTTHAITAGINYRF